MKQFESERFKVTVHPNLIKEFTVKSNATLQVKDIWESTQLSDGLVPGARFFVLFEGETDSDITNEAKRAAASNEYFKYVAALALYSDKIVETIRGNLFLKINRPKVPTRFFDNRDKALVWLRQQAGIL